LNRAIKRIVAESASAATILALALVAGCGGETGAADLGDAVTDAVADVGYADDLADLADLANVADAADSADLADVADAADSSEDSDGHDLPPVRLCNGLAELCDRPLNQVAFATTHNSMANLEDEFGIPNQRTGVATSLDAGVRAFMLDTWYLNTSDPPETDDVYLCHGLCMFGARPLADTLEDIRDFLAANPDEVVAIIFESYVTAEHTKVSFDVAGVTDMLIDLDSAAAIPTMAETIDAGKRLLVFTDNEGGGFPGYLDVWKWAWDNDWDNKAPADLNCDVNRGSGENAFFILNHFLTDPVASEDLATSINFNPFFIDQATKCRDSRGHIPNFVTVDFYEIGDVIDVVETLNLALDTNQGEP
jgi:hypothetical protein